MSVYRLTLSLSRHLHQYLDNSVNSSSWSTSPAMYGNSLGSINMNYGTRSYQCSVAYSGSAQNFPTISNPSMYEVTRISAIINYSQGHSYHGSNVAGASWVSVVPTATCKFGLYMTYPGPSCGSAIASNPNNQIISLDSSSTARINLSSYNSNSIIQILSQQPSLLCVIIQAQLCTSGAEMLTPGTTLTLEIEYKAKYIPIPAPTWSLDASNYLYNNKIYVSKNSFTPSQKNKFELTWQAPSMSEESDTFVKYGLYAYINGGNFTTIANPTTTSYTIDFSTFQYGNGISLKEGDIITFYLSSFGEQAGESSRIASANFYINYRPSEPKISNTIIPSISDSINFNYSLGTDSQENMNVSLLWSHSKPDPSLEWESTSSSIITKNDVGVCYAYTYDGWDLSDATEFTIEENKKPSILVNIQNIEDKFVIFSASQDGYTNDTIEITPSKIKEQNNKTLTNIRYYIRSSTTSNLISSAAIKILPYGSESYIINPFYIDALVYPAQYYQIGVQASDGIEDTDIHWVPDILQIYGGIILSEENIPMITSTDTINGLGDYSNYYKAPTFKITYKLPSIPAGLEKLYYQFSYLTNAQTDTWTLLGNRIEFTSNTQQTQTVTIPYILSNVKFKINIITNLWICRLRQCRGRVVVK